jgi:hypothetical protein
VQGVAYSSILNKSGSNNVRDKIRHLHEVKEMNLSLSEWACSVRGCYHIYIRACRDLNLTSTLLAMSNMFGFGSSAPSSPPQMTPRTTTTNTFSFEASSPPRTGGFGGFSSEANSPPNTKPNTFSFGVNRPLALHQKAPRTRTTLGGNTFERPRSLSSSLSSSTLSPLASPRSPSTAGVSGSFGAGSTGSFTRPSISVNQPLEDQSNTILSDVRVAKTKCLE